MTEAPVAAEVNPLLSHGVLPLFDQIETRHVVPGVKALLQSLHLAIDELEQTVQPSWEGLLEPLERISDRHQRVWGVVSHLKGVKDSADLRKAVEEVQPENVKLGLRLSQSKAIYAAFKALKDGSQWEALTAPQKRIVDNELRDFVLGGVALEGEAKERYNAIQQELTQLATKFSNNVLDATKAFKKLLTLKSEVDGLPSSALALGAQSAKMAGHEAATPEDGPWLFTLDFPSYQPVLTHSKNRPLREEMYRAFATRASVGELDNAPLIERVLLLRREKANLLGFENFAELSMASKMATLPTAEALLAELQLASVAAAKKDLQEVRDFAAAQGVAEEVMWWDIGYWAERLREARYNISDEELRPYFALPNVLDGLFSLANRLFGIEVVPADGEAPVWHPDARFFKVLVEGKPKAQFFLDPYSGHALQHMLTQVEEGMVSGIRGIEWDAVELPSQFMENWAYDRSTLYSFAKHYTTGEPLPEGLFTRLSAAKTFRSGTMMLRQIHFSSIDLDLHSRFVPGGGQTVFERDQALAAKTQVMPPFPEDRFLCAFSHIFAGGYSAGYFSYKWAEVLSADAFSAFEEVGLDDDAKVRETGRRFRDTVLSLGGGSPPSEVFRSFRGREPSTQALLKHYNLLPAAQAATVA
ncbi:MAG: hypothetical protein WDW38_001321 [Sanguina aurantia]